MTRSGQAAILAAILAATGLAGQGALADVTPEEVWQNWLDSATAQGQKVSAASTSMDGDTLTVSGITVETTGANGAGSALIGEIKFRDKGDGSVAILLPDSFPVLMTLPAPPGVEGATPVEMKLTVSMPGADITASGVPLSLSYASSAPSVEITADVAEAGGSQMTTVLARLSDVTVNHLIEAAETGSNQTQDFAAATLDLSVKTSGTPDQDMALTLSLSGLAGQSALTGIPAAGMADMPAALNAGMTMQVGGSYGIGSFDLTGKDAGQPLKMTGALGGGTLDMDFSATRFGYEATGKSVSLNFSGTDTSTGDPMTISATLANTSSQIEMTGANWAGIEDFPAALQAGLTVAGGFGVGPTSFDFAGGGDGGKTALTAALGGMDTSFAMDADAMRYDFGAKALTMSLASPDLPMPEAAVSVTELALDFAMPLAKSSQPAPFNMLVKVVDLGVADALWAMVDPGGMLPHDPATVILDTEGTTTLTRDLVDSAMAMQSGEAPGLLNSLDLTQMLLRAAGAELTAAGGFTFDNTDMTTLPGMPLPTGKIDIKGVGVNGLIDTLVTMGLLPEDQAMQGRMMLSMFANSSADKDEITSVLEFKDGHFFANGQQLQ